MGESANRRRLWALSLSVVAVVFGLAWLLGALTPVYYLYAPWAVVPFEYAWLLGLALSSTVYLMGDRSARLAGAVFAALVAVALIGTHLFVPTLELLRQLEWLTELGSALDSFMPLLVGVFGVLTLLFFLPAPRATTH